VIGDDEQAVGDRDDGLLVPAALDQPAVLGREVAVACAHGAAGTLHEGLAQDPVGEARAAAQTFAGALVVACAEARSPDCFRHAVRDFQLYRSADRTLDPKLRELGELRAGWARDARDHLAKR
jgi:hypothetical protein